MKRRMEESKQKKIKKISQRKREREVTKSQEDGFSGGRGDGGEDHKERRKHEPPREIIEK